MTEFTPLTSLFGGMLIGLSALLIMFTNGKIAGISGIVASFLPPNKDRSKLVDGSSFVVGLLLAIPFYNFLSGSAPEQVVSTNLPLLGLAGLLVGFGAVLGSGCTSGHGVCGISRLSPRSIVATLVFMATGIFAVFVLRHLLGI